MLEVGAVFLFHNNERLNHAGLVFSSVKALSFLPQKLIIEQFQFNERCQELSKYSNFNEIIL